MTHRTTTKMADYAHRISCGHCGRLGHKTTTCGATHKAHDKLGVEIEGWWSNLSEVQERARGIGADDTRDGSLVDDPSGETAAREFRSRPGSLGATLRQVHALYPDKAHRSAGMHIHMSFLDPHDASMLCDAAFEHYARDRWTAWGHRMQINEGSQFWERLGGHNHYCAKWSDADLTTFRGTTRYRWLNFQSWGHHRTVELRMLPLFQAEYLAHGAIAEWVSIVETWIARQRVHLEVPIEISFPAIEADDELISVQIDLPALEPDDTYSCGVDLYAAPDSVPGAVITTAAAAQRVLRDLITG